MNLFRLERLTGSGSYGRRGRELLESFSGDVRRRPSAYTQSLMATMLALLPGLEIVVASRKEPEQLQRDLKPLARVFAPDATYLYRLDGGQCAGLDDVAPFTSGMAARNGETTFYVCRNYACQEPTNDIDRVVCELSPDGASADA